MANVATRYSEYVAHAGATARARALLRDAAVTALATGRRLDPDRSWLRILLYHHVFDDERAGFERQLRFMQRFGRFVSLDEAVAMLESERPIDGVTFCVTFDDGYRNSLTNALPILDRLGIPATFYVITDLVGTTVAEHRPALERHFAGGAIVEFLDWDACRDLARAGMAIGSHTASHADLARCDEAGAWAELTGSKALIEAQLGGRCDHFCAPFGIAGVNFDATRHPALAAEAGYRSFATGRRGPMHAGDSPFALRRDQLLANWGTSQVRYLLGR